VIAGLHPSPIDQAHFTTTCTHKQLYGPRGGLILIGRDAAVVGPDGKRTLSDMMQRGVFPFLQGAPIMNAIAAKARALANAQRPEFKLLAERIMDDASALARCFVERGYHVVSGGSSNHLVILDVGAQGLTGVVAERALEECGIIVNKNRIPGDTRSALVTSGIRLGTNTLAYRGMGVAEMPRCAELIDQVLSAVSLQGSQAYALDATHRAAVRGAVHELCGCYPIPLYPLA
jgi:glycine hydroxymethyltransferase